MATSLSATVQAASGRTLLQLTFTTVTAATISRIHPDGTAWPVRNANPIPVNSTTGVGAIVYDHEAPLDVACTYKASSTQVGTTFTSSAVTMPSDGGNIASNIWLIHPTKPALSMVALCESVPGLTRRGRAGILPILGRADPIAVTDVRLSGSGEVNLTTLTTADAAKLRALVADGAVSLLKLPATWANNWMYVVFGDLSEAGLTAGPEPTRDWKLPYTVVAPPAGGSQGAVGASYNELAAAYATYTLLAAGEATYNDAAIKAGP